MGVTIAGDGGKSTVSNRLKAQWWCREVELVERLDVLREAVFTGLGAGSELPAVQWDAPGRSTEIISVLTHACIEGLHNAGKAKVDVAQEFCRLILVLQQLAIDFYLHDTAVRGQRLADCASGLSRLRGLPGSDVLLDTACEELVLRCGFHRAVLSRVKGRSWKPLTIHDRSQDSGRSWFSEWINQSVPLQGAAPETELLTKRRPALVYDTANAPVYRPLIVAAGHSRSYVVAPLIHGEDVMGFLHVDHHPLPRRVDEADREVLWAFADGFGHVYERTVLIERLRAQRDSARDLFFAALDRMDELCESAVGSAGHGELEAPRAEGSGPAVESRTPSDLTEREAEVFELLVTGATNQAIADELVITEGTVKSHVKHILRKAGAVNRAQAVAWSLQGHANINV
jgi:DNA-binding CsgD family transcriptional regulator/GAF domain-containing protein